jgi:glucose-1-phosphate cytidylyltransferase
MKVVILAGGLGTRISEETHLRPKPMVEIGGKPILWHILKSYSHHGINEFVICCGYKGYIIKEYFANYFMHTSDITFDIALNNVEVHRRKAESWKVTIVDTGEATMTGGRLRRIREFLGNDPFCCTYGDGVSNINITESIAFHRSHGLSATLTAVQPPARFGVLELDGMTKVKKFREKPQNDNTWINGGFFILDPSVIDRIDGDEIALEQEPLQLAKDVFFI